MPGTPTKVPATTKARRVRKLLQFAYRRSGRILSGLPLAQLRQRSTDYSHLEVPSEIYSYLEVPSEIQPVDSLSYLNPGAAFNASLVASIVR
jgi:hypothetical protein